MVSNTIEVKKLNKERIREAIQKQERCTKAEIAKETMLSIATCSTILNEMLENGEIIKIDQEDAGIGRPASLFTYNKDYQHVLGLCIETNRGVNTIDCAVADALGNIILHETVQPENMNYERIAETVASFLEQDDKIAAIGIGIPGIAQNGLVEYCDIKDLVNVNIGQLLRDKYGIDVFIENDMNFITYRLYDLQPRKEGNLAAVFFPDRENGYVGCGFMINGHILKGASMFSGEVAYAASGYGISQQEQAKLLENREAFQRFAAQVLLTVVCTINPANAVFMGNDISQEDLDEIRKHCLAIVPARHIPCLSVDNSMAENYICGVVRFTLDSLQFPVSMDLK